MMLQICVQISVVNGQCNTVQISSNHKAGMRGTAVTKAS